MIRFVLAVPAIILLSSCVGPRAAEPAAAPRPVVRPVPPPSTAPAATVDRYAGDWSVADLDPSVGDWIYRRQGSASSALLGGELQYLARLECTAGKLTISRAGTVATGGAASLNIRTSFAERSLSVEIVMGSGRGGTPAMLVAASLPASDPLWDQMIYSRGRFVIEATGNAPMIVPVRPELARVVEDCRG